MVPSLSFIFQLQGLVAAATSQAVSGLSRHDLSRDITCTVKSQRKAWQNLTGIEKSRYIDATLCLINSPTKIGVSVAKTRWDDFQYAHALNMPYIHNVGAFLPWHRYFITVYERVLRDECGYEGAMPYWNEPLDADSLPSSPIFDPVSGFGGNGTGFDLCVADGPFADLTLRISENVTTAESEYCLTRNFNPCIFRQGAQQRVADRCILSSDTFEEVRQCIESQPHGAGHGGVGALMLNVKLSPGDPIFYLHHTYLDKLWWEWQARNLTHRLTDMSGTNTQQMPSFNISGFNSTGLPLAGANQTGFPGGISGGGGGGGNQSMPFNLSCFPGFPGPFPGNMSSFNGTQPQFSMPKPDASFTDYFDDGGGNTTTLNHVLYSAGIAKNMTIRDVMDIRAGFVCAEYV
ncbi:amino acid transporter [Diplogelasinospora grovesii]|uniref:Amino acid transporter n=1 Tax=Diplogelasinospora grovesii TaxID=303347 RepID=A0AAN6MXY1_9PEZI|nr:amino acid transporter [Diplogelasinospora grovesii]